MHPTALPLIGVEIGGTKLQAVAGLSDGTILERHRASVNRDAGAQGILDWTAKTITQLLQSKPDVGAVGIGFGGPVETATGRVLTSHQIAGWENLPIKKWFEEHFQLPVLVANDANAAGWAEYCLGAGQGTRRFMYMNIGSGIGGALVIHGELYDGQGRGACEIGHTWIPDWTAGRPGIPAKLEHLCSGWAIEKRLRQVHPDSLSPVLRQRCGGNPSILTCAMLAHAAGQGDPQAQEEIGRVANAIAIALANAIALFHPERIALGGGVSLMGEVLLTPIRQALQHYIFAPYRDSVELVSCKLEEDVVAVGALLLAGRHFDEIRAV